MRDGVALSILPCRIWEWCY